MPPSKTWQHRERKAAAQFDSKRTPLSGGNSGHTRSDSLSDSLFLECKHRKVHAVGQLYRSTKKLARKEGKTPVVCLTEHGRHGMLFVVHSDDLDEVCHQLLMLRERLCASNATATGQ